LTSVHLQDTSRSSLAELLLSDLLQMENEVLEEDGFPLPEGEPEDIRLDLERAAGTGPLLAPRERKAGCKNFFWKTFTSC
ncbi:somatostatin-1, partial [Austrofundulus limnaeus]|uniref:Somatostatin-1 n=1 Tax=Austrofundulus limnaeus TaxID=52670 RepID=A0A2I4AK26_AUSLI